MRTGLPGGSCEATSTGPARASLGAGETEAGGWAPGVAFAGYCVVPDAAVQDEQ